MVECNLPKVDVAGSSPVFRSIENSITVRQQGREPQSASFVYGSSANELRAQELSLKTAILFEKKVRSPVIRE